MYITYFYNVRNLPNNFVPFSTAVYDPRWFHEDRGPKHTFLDKRGVVNGLRCNPLVPDGTCNNLCHGPTSCSQGAPDCVFLQKYREQVQKVDLVALTDRMKSVCDQLSKKLLIPNMEPILLVYEAKDNPCSERIVLKEEFGRQGIELVEFDSSVI